MATVACFLGGVSVGWIVGLSVSPNIQAVLTAVLAVVVALASALSGLSGDTPPRDNTATPSAGATLTPNRMVGRYNPWPVVMLTIGLAFGSPIGVYARTNLWFTTDSKKMAAWTGLNEKVISQRIFNQVYPPQSKSVPEHKDSKKEDAKKDETPPLSRQAGIAGLFSAPTESDCSKWKSYIGAKKYKELNVALQEYPDPIVIAIGKNISDAKKLEAFVASACPSGGS